MIRRKRNKENLAPAAPIDLKTLHLPEIYKTYSPNDGISEQFLLADSGQESDRVLIFGRLSGLKILKNSRTWYCDGTFRIAPLLFSQVYVILAEPLGGVHPIIYALLPSKKASVYEKLLNMLKTLEPDLNPDLISCDFELAAFTAIKDAFPNVQIFGTCPRCPPPEIKQLTFFSGSSQSPLFLTIPFMNGQIRLVLYNTSMFDKS